MAEKVYELGRYIGNGRYSFFFALRGEAGLGVKIRASDTSAKKLLKEEYEKSKTLKKFGIPVPNYIGLIKVYVPENLDKTLGRAKERKVTGSWFNHGKEDVLKQRDKVVWGLAMEIIENDLTLVSTGRIDYLYHQEYARAQKMGIKIDDSSSSHNILWSKEKAKLYFIDFDFWTLPSAQQQRALAAANGERGDRSWWQKLFSR